MVELPPQSEAPLADEGRDRCTSRPAVQGPGQGGWVAQNAATGVPGRSRRVGPLRSTIRQGHEARGRLPWDELRIDGHLRRMRSAPDSRVGRLRQEVPGTAAARRMDPCPSGWSSWCDNSRDRDRLFARLPLEGTAGSALTPLSQARESAGLSREGRVERSENHPRVQAVLRKRVRRNTCDC